MRTFTTTIAHDCGSLTLRLAVGYTITPGERGNRDYPGEPPGVEDLHVIECEDQAIETRPDGFGVRSQTIKLNDQQRATLAQWANLMLDLDQRMADDFEGHCQAHAEQFLDLHEPADID
jgi:hypothetical protein